MALTWFNCGTHGTNRVQSWYSMVLMESWYYAVWSVFAEFSLDNVGFNQSTRDVFMVPIGPCRSTSGFNHGRVQLRFSWY